MVNRRWLIALLALMLPALVLAQAGRGQRELALSGSGTSSRDFDGGTLSATGEYGVYYSPRVELGVRQSFSWSKSDAGSSWSGATRFYADYHFGDAQWRPYFGANLGGIYGEDTDTIAVAGPEAGLKFYVQPAAFLYGQMEYQIFFEGTSEVWNSLDEGAFFYSFGAGYNF